MNGKGVAQLLGVSAAWSVYYVSTQYLNSQVLMFTAGSVVRLITVILFVGFLFVRHELPKLYAPPKARPRLILIGVLCFILDTAAFIGFAHSSAGVGTALLKFDIVFVNLLSIFIYKKKPSLRNWLFTALMLCGVLVLIGVDFESFSLSDPYLLLFLASAFVVSCNAFLVQSAQRTYPQLDDMAIIFYNLLFSGLCFLVVSVIYGATLNETAQLFAKWPVLLSALIGGMANALLFVLYYKSLRQFSVWLVKIVLLTMPAISAVISLIVFGDTLGSRELLGMLIICFGALLILRSEQKASENIPHGHNG